MMEEKDGVVTKVEGVSSLPPLNSSTIAIAINGKKKSKYVVRWALNKFVPEGKVCFKLLHVRPRITGVPTPMGSFIPISQVRDDVVAAFRKDVEWQTSEILLPYKMLCTRRKVQVEVLQLESDDIVKAIAQEVTKLNIIKLVIGASSRSIFSRGQSLSSRISDSTPTFCTIYAVSKGKLLSVRPSDSEINGSSSAEDSYTSCSITSSTGHTSSSLTERSEPDSSSSYSHFRSPSLPMQRFQALSHINQNLPHRRASSNESVHHKNYSLDFGDGEDDVSSCPQGTSLTDGDDPASSFRSLVTDNYLTADDQASISGAQTDSSSGYEADINFELEKLRTELRHTRGMYAVAQTEVIDASRKIKELHKRRLEEDVKFREICLKEEEVKELARKENEKYEAAKEEADYVKDCAEREAAQREEAELLALREAKEKDKLENALTGQAHQYQEFTWEEIISSTSSFAENLKIGMGAYGTVYKCSLHHTTVAIKVLHSEGSHLTRQFQQELEILSKISHPHLLILLGVCPDRGCLVYEFMENGSLEERLLRKHDTPPIPWFDRYRIAWEVASALAFLHNSKPDPIIHRDLKPANILLDRNFVSKIGDVGLSTMINSDTSLSTIYKDTGPVGTLCYIDPEYQRTGMISPKSDIYAFGMVLLQLLTSKAAMGLPHIVETAIDKDNLTKVLDSEAGKWPLEETKKLAMLALKCTELCRRDRPDLKGEILPALEKLKEVADKARDSSSTTRPPPPNYYLCPLLKDIMEEPCVAADGYTYDRKAIETWLKENDISPMTNLPLAHKNVLPNYALLSLTSSPVATPGFMHGSPLSDGSSHHSDSGRLGDAVTNGVVNHKRPRPLDNSVYSQCVLAMCVLSKDSSPRVAGLGRKVLLIIGIDQNSVKSTVESTTSPSPSFAGLNRSSSWFDMSGGGHLPLTFRTPPVRPPRSSYLTGMRRVYSLDFRHHLMNSPDSGLADPLLGSGGSSGASERSFLPQSTIYNWSCGHFSKPLLNAADDSEEIITRREEKEKLALDLIAKCQHCSVNRLHNQIASWDTKFECGTATALLQPFSPVVIASDESERIRVWNYKEATLLNSFDNHGYPDKGISKLCLVNELDQSLLLVASSKYLLLHVLFYKY